MRRMFGWLGVAALLGLGLAACRGETPVGPDPAMKAQAAPAQGSPGGAVMRVNTPETDPDQYVFLDTSVEPGGAPIKLIEGPAILARLGNSEYNYNFATGGFYLSDGTICDPEPTPPGTMNYVSADKFSIVPTGKVLCFVPPETAWESPVRVSLAGYRPYR